MKVLHIEAGQHLYGGAQQVAYLLSGLQKKGIDNHLCAPAGSAIANYAKRQHIPCHTTEGAGDVNIRFFWEMQRIIEQQQPDLVHLHSRRGADWLGGLATRYHKTPCILSRRVDHPEPRWLVPIKYALYDHVITISHCIEQVLLDSGVPENKLSCIHSAVDSTAYQAPPERKNHRQAFQTLFKVNDQHIVLAMIAHLIPRKGHHYLLSILPELLQVHPEIKVLIFGQGQLEAELKQETHRLGLDEQVVFTGFRDDIAHWLHCIDVVIHPADKEGLGVALLQSSAAGVPIIATRAGGIPEVVQHRVNGLLIDTGDTRALSNAIKQLVTNPKLRQKMGLAGQKIIQDHFSLQAMITGNLAIYQQVLNTKKAAL